MRLDATEFDVDLHKNELMIDTAKRSAKSELNFNIKIEKYLGVYESLNNFRHDLSHGFIVSKNNGKLITDFQSSNVKFFKRIPSNTVAHHKKMIKDAVKEAIQEELKDILLEAIKSPKNPINESFIPPVNIGNNGTQKYMVKQGKNKGKIL